jgi:hypothetical protein
MTDQQNEPTREQIERRAYQIYLERGAQDGQELADWLAAEQELTAMAQPRPAAKATKRDAAAA